MTWLDAPTRYTFFAGKGGVGKTSLAAATAVALADRGKKVLLVSTDPASNLDDMLGAPLRNQPTVVAGVEGLSLANIDPEAAAQSYRARVIEQMGPDATDADRAAVREQLSGACTTEIAAFDEFSDLLADGADDYDHVIFDTAPTGHTLRLLSLPKAWSGFLEGNERGASCLGPHSGLKMQEERFRRAMQALADPRTTSVVLVARPETSTLREAARTATELHELGLGNQRLVVNGVLQPVTEDEVAQALAREGAEALARMPAILQGVPRDEVPLRAFDMVGVPALRALLGATAEPTAESPETAAASPRDLPGLAALADALSKAGHGLVMVMGKGGVGKTTIAAALALALQKRGCSVHLTTTDPAAHLTWTLAADVPGLTVSRIDPKVETQRYIAKVMEARGRNLDAPSRALLLEDLQSPCTEEVAVFHAFSHLVNQAGKSFVVMDTAPTGHSLLLMDAAGAYHRQMMHSMQQVAGARVVTPLMRMQDPGYTQVVLVTLPETTPVTQAAALQEDLRRAGVEPYAWVMNRSLVAAGSHEPVLRARMAGERRQMERIRDRLARRLYVVPLRTRPLVGVDALVQLLDATG
jgi:arsenite/tail-anchored protein-transporting ATPase